MGTITQRLGRAGRVAAVAAVTVGLSAGLAVTPAQAALGRMHRSSHR
jgi:hypothetical protein